MNRVARTFGWLALALFATGSIIHRVTGESPRPVVLPPPPPSLVDDILRDSPDRDVVVLMGSRKCGAPFMTILNYMHKRSAEEPAFPSSLALVTGVEESRYTRELDHRYGVDILIDDELVELGLPYGNAIIVERRGQGERPLVHQFDLDVTDQVIEALDRIFEG